ncbi:MAG: MMPL family transporter [Solirubrobacterales bacterium]|nr:MMPL family transporter [Solirubrobacterales bacterium]
MNLPDFYRRATERAARSSLKKPPIVIAIAGLLAVGAALLALNLTPDTGVESITGTKSETYKSTQVWAKNFGGDPIVVVAKGKVAELALGPDLGVMLGLEGCLSGKIPTKALAAQPKVCKEIAKLKPAVAVYGPGTFVNTAVISIQETITKLSKQALKQGKEAGKAAAEVARRSGKGKQAQQKARKAADDATRLQLLTYALKLGTQYNLGIGSQPSLNNPEFIARLIFDPINGSDEPKGKWSYIFPSKNAAIIQVRLRPGLSSAQRAEAVDLVKRATADNKYALAKGQYFVTGAPVVLAEVEDSIQRAIVILLIAALIVMAIALLVVFPAELRLLPLMLALMAAAGTYGLLALTGSSIGVGAVAVLPVLVGLAVDYAIQFHARADRAMQSGASPPEAVMQAATSGGPPVLAAATATIAALLALILSPIPLIRGFGLLLVIGVALAIVIVLTAGFATLGWAGGASKRTKRRQPAETVAGWMRLRKLFNRTAANPRKTVQVALAVALVGWVAGLLSPVTTDIQQLVPGNLGAVEDAREFQKLSGTSGTVDVLVQSKDVTDPKAVKWMIDFQKAALVKAGYKGEAPTCAKSELCPALSLAGLFEGQKLTQANVRRTLTQVGDFSRGAVTPDRKMATIAFGLREEALNDQKKSIDQLRDRIEDKPPPAGTTATVVGLNAQAADASGALSNPFRRLLMALVALGLLLLVVRGVSATWRKSYPPVLSVAAAGGISALLLFILRIDLNPMSAALGVFIIAIAGEFTLLIHMQYLRERKDSAQIEVIEAFRRAYKTIGPAVFASGVTAIAGFAALAVSDINMLRGFAIVAVVDLAVALLSTVVLLPAITAWLEEEK